MLSDEKISHVVHLMLDGIEKAGMVSYSAKDEAIREARKAFNQFITQLSGAAEAARQRIQSQKNAPPEHSRQWETLYQKYYEEELRKRGG